MANPQKENGYVGIANELMEHVMRLPIDGGGFRILLSVIRRTYGFRKKKDYISLSKFQEYTGMSRSHVLKQIKKLVLYRVLVKDGNMYNLNKNWEEWVVLYRVPPGLHRVLPSTPQSTTASTLQSTHKRHVLKTSLQKTKNNTKKDENQLSDLDKNFMTFYRAYPRKQGKALAREAFEKINPNEALLGKIIRCLKHHENRIWNDSFIPNPAKWLDDTPWEGWVDSGDPRNMIHGPIEMSDQ